LDTILVSFKKKSTVQCVLLFADYWYSSCLYAYNKCISVQPLAIVYYKHTTVLPDFADFHISSNHDKFSRFSWLKTVKSMWM